MDAISRPQLVTLALGSPPHSGRAADCSGPSGAVSSVTKSVTKFGWLARHPAHGEAGDRLAART